ncbi:sulfotransferase domain-containing protein [Salinibacter ruber]|uniref:sulfotransferase domain-containing protein n=1 Tax=Salinibacter ruber TaxID=146919 RepID=UPI00207482E9|nr:sulfotransferase domain-containing protein [Salinibacter ruber]
MKEEIVTPTFILGGAPKAGTTSLYRYLQQHPQVCMSARKETSVFIDDKGLEWLSDTHYRHYDGESAVGEASAGTLGNPDVTERVYDALPDVKLIFVLRDPIERTFSHYRFLRGVGGLEEWEGVEGTASFSELIRAEGTEWREIHIDLGMYHRHLTRFEQYFEREQMLILLFSDLKKNPSQVVERIFRFVGVDPSFQPDLAVHNTSRSPRFERLYQAATSLWTTVKRRVDISLINKTRPVRRAVKQFLTEETSRSEIPPDDEEYLRGIYAEPNQRLEEWLGRDLSHWR